MTHLDTQIQALQGPILVVGASGFVGANLLRSLLSVRQDVVGTVYSGRGWRLEGVAPSHIMRMDRTDAGSITSVLDQVKPATIFDTSSFGAYAFEQDVQRIHNTNYLSFLRMMELVESRGLAAYVQAGSSSEYGLNASGPAEDAPMLPNSQYAVSKAAASHVVSYYGKVRKVPVVNLRLYSVYGPYEDSSRLIPVLCDRSLKGELPTFAQPHVTRDFVHVQDVVGAFVCAALAMPRGIAGESFNIGTGVATTLEHLAQTAKGLWNISTPPQFNVGAGRAWDVDNWFANPAKAHRLLDWSATISLEEGLTRTQQWWSEHLKVSPFTELTKKQSLSDPGNRQSIAAIIACYKDAQAIPIMHSRLSAVLGKLHLDYKIIFVNDGSPDNSSDVIAELSAKDPHVRGIVHSRNFGSQAAFRSGMELADTDACVLLDGDLQDPPELIEQFVAQWRSGADVVYGRRIKREMPVWLEWFYRAFYRLFSAMSEVPVPKDAGDFSLLDRQVVHWMLRCEERDAFLRGLRAFVGFKQVGVDYVRPERMFGVSTNNWTKNIGWAKKGIFSFSRMPLHLLTAFGGVACLLTMLMAVYVIAVRLLRPEHVPQGITYVSLLVMFFGSASILGIGLLGEYIGKIFEETKARPHFIRRYLIRDGAVQKADLPPP